jgi:hypothetical protein
MSRNELIKELLGDDSDYIASRLEEAYNGIKEDFESGEIVPLFSYNEEEEHIRVRELLNAETKNAER